MLVEHSCSTLQCVCVCVCVWCVCVCVCVCVHMHVRVCVKQWQSPVRINFTDLEHTMEKIVLLCFKYIKLYTQSNKVI